MAETLTFDPTPPAEVMSSIDADQAESLAIGEAMIAEQEGLLAGKYKDAAALEQAYLELQKKLGQGDNEEEGEAEEGEQEEYEETDEESDDYVIDFLAEVDQEFSTNGQLSEETLEKFSQMSSRELVDAYFRYQEQNGGPQQQQAVELSTADINQIKNSVGGEAAYQQLTSWAAENFSPEEVEAFDSVVESGNMAAINLALQALYYRYTDAVGFEGETLQGKPARSMDVFRSQAEVVRAMSDPRYERDPAYRQDIIDKLARSDVDF